MTTPNDYNEKKRASEDLFAKEAAGRGVVEETTPEIITPEVQSFAAETGWGGNTGCSRLRPVRLYGWCSDGVAEKIRVEGGSIVFGWTIWEWADVLLTAEFHAVWKSPDGVLFDITPKPHGEKTIIFVPKPGFPQDFNFGDRPANRQRRLYSAADQSGEVAARMAAMKPAQRSYEMRRATKAGMTLERWLASHLPIDPLPALIDDFIATVAAVNAKMETAERIGVGLISPNRELIRLMQKRMSLSASIKAERAARRR